VQGSARRNDDAVFPKFRLRLFRTSSFYGHCAKSREAATVNGLLRRFPISLGTGCFPPDIHRDSCPDEPFGREFHLQLLVRYAPKGWVSLNPLLAQICNLCLVLQKQQNKAYQCVTTKPFQTAI
jgi:hypothetical protein